MGSIHQLGMRCSLTALAFGAAAGVGESAGQPTIGPANPYTIQCQHVAGPEPLLIGPDASAKIQGLKPAASAAEERRLRDMWKWQASFAKCAREGEARNVDALMAEIFLQSERLDRQRPGYLPGSTETKIATLFPLSGTMAGLFDLYHDVSGTTGNWEELQLGTRQALRRALIDEIMRAGGRSPDQVYTEFVGHIESGRYFGATYKPSPASQALLRELAGTLQDDFDYPDRAARLRRHRDEGPSVGAAPALQRQLRSKLDMGTKRIDAAVAEQKRLRSTITKDFASATEKLAASIAAQDALPFSTGRSRPAYEVERDLFSGSSAEERLALLESYLEASPTRQKTDPLFSRLLSLAPDEIRELQARAQTQYDAKKFGEAANNYAMAFSGLSAINRATGAGNDDINRLLAAGSMGSSALIEGARILATPGMPPAVQAIALLGVVGNFSSALGGIFGGNGPDRTTQQLHAALASLQRSLTVISSQISYVQAYQEIHFATLETKSNQILNYVNRPFETGYQQCQTVSRVMGPVRGAGRNALTIKLEENGSWTKVNECNALLRSLPRSDGTTYRDLAFAKVWTTSLADQPPDQQDDYTLFIAHFVNELYKRDYLRLVDRLLEERAAAKAEGALVTLSPFFLLARNPSSTVAELQDKMAATVPFDVAADQELGPLLDSLGSSVNARPWTLRRFMDTPVATPEALALIGSVDILADVLPFVDGNTGKPIVFKDGPLPSSEVFEHAFKYGTKLASGQILEAIPVAEQVVGQETMFAGDFLLLKLSALLDLGDCAGLDPADTSGSEAEMTLKADRIAACNLIRESAALRRNLAIYRLRTAKESQYSAYGAEYAMAYASSDALHLKAMFGDRILSFVNLVGGTPHYYYRLSGDCRNVGEAGLNIMIGAISAAEYPMSHAAMLTKSADIGSGAAKMEFDRSKLKVCVASPMPHPEYFQRGHLTLPSQLQSATALRDKLVERAYRRAALQKLPDTIRAAMNLAVGGR